MQDATADGYLHNFAQAMAAYTPDNIPIFLGNNFCAWHDYELSLQEQMQHPITFYAKMNGDIMYLHQALRQNDAADFVHAVVKEVNDHVSLDHWPLINSLEVSEDVTVAPSVWEMQCKHDFATNTITKYKVCLNLHGGKQEFGVNYYETYAPVITWFAI